MDTCVEYFEEGGAVSTGLKGYETRVQQIEMVRAVEDAIRSYRPLIVEAGTGTGKSLAYLVPFILWTVKENKRAVISTYTKTLQNQLFIKDLPFLEDVLGVDLRYARCVGSNNYVCMFKASMDVQADMFEDRSLSRERARIKEWIKTTDTGLAMDMDFVPSPEIWSDICRDSDMCAGKRCGYYGECFYMKARREQASSHILIANHYLLFSDMVSGASSLPSYDGLVLDEAHTLEDVATSQFAEKISDLSADRLAEAITAVLRTSGDGIKRPEGRMLLAEAGSRVMEFRSSCEEFFGTSSEKLGKAEGQVDINTVDFFYEGISASLDVLSSSLTGLSGYSEDAASTEMLSAAAEKCKKMKGTFDFIFGENTGDYVRWADVRDTATRRSCSFNAAPVDVSGILRTALFERAMPMVLTSATLAVPGSADGGFSFIKNRIGLGESEGLILDSPFDHAANVMMYMPDMRNEPSYGGKGFYREVAQNVTGIFRVTLGGTFVLFTSYEMMYAVAAEVAAIDPGIKIFRQGDLPRYVLLDVFKRQNQSMLFGTTTFWQGVDVPGDLLRCVIITKLPFSVPSTPVNAARIRSIKEQGLNPFYEYQVPEAVIMFKQGFGRLIRSCSDRGVVAVLDPRIKTKRYGKAFLDAVPRCQRSSHLDDIRSFMGPGTV